MEQKDNHIFRALGTLCAPGTFLDKALEVSRQERTTRLGNISWHGPMFGGLEMHDQVPD